MSFYPQPCPLCQKENKNTELEYVFAFSCGELASLEPLSSTLASIHMLFANNLVKDMAYCPAGHGFIDLRVNKTINEYRELMDKFQKIKYQ